ncbi:phage tail spike protein, partial [Bacillus thuringiensis]|uniref:phage tail spike protein n=2 Tax=Bacillus TaxID=1386 RepID=UPI00381A591A
MRTPSGILHVVDFKTDQIISVIQSKDYWDDKRHWEIKNNIDTLEFKTFDGTSHAVALQQQNLVLKEVRDGRIVPYVINNEVEKESNDRTITVHASGAWVQIAKDGFIKPQHIESETVNTFIDIALADSKWKRGKTDYSSFHTMTIDEFIDPLAFLKKIATLFELEIQYRVEVVGSQITGRYVDMIRKRGQETGKEVVLGKDLVGVRRIEHSRDICTALVGFVRDEGDKLITIESINNGLPYIVDNDAFQRWNEHGKHKFGFYTPETEGNITPERLLTLMKTELAKRVSSVSYEVEAQSIGRIFGLAHELINEGDTIRIKDTGFTPKLYLEARAIVGDESHTDPSQDQYVFGDYREITDANEELRKMYNRIRATLGNKANKELLDRLEELVQDTDKKVNEAQKESKAAKELAEKVQENLKNNTVEIIEAVNPPTTNLKIGKTIWRDISNGKPGVLKVWNGKGWELLIPDVESIKKDTLEQVNKDIKLAKEELNKKVEEAQQETTGQFNTVTESLQKVTRTISDVQRDQGEIDKKVTQVEQDSEKFKLSIETLTKNSSETTNKINTLESDVDGNTKVISQVKESVANINDDVRNLLIGSKSFDGALNFAQADNRWWFKSADKVKISKDVFQGNAVVETQSSWTALAYNFKDLVNRGVVKVGDKVTYSIYTRVKGLPDGQELQHTFYFAPGATGIRPNKSTNQWQRVSVSFTVTASMMSLPGTDNESHLRIEPDANPPAGCWYQQSSPQLTIGSKDYSWRPAPEDIADGNVFTKITTEIKEEAGRISKKLEQVESRTVGVENWLINTGRNQKPQTIGMSGGALVNKAAQSFTEDYMIVECTDHTDSFYQFHLDNTKMGDYEKEKDMTFSIDMQNDALIDLIVFQFINGVWAENLYNRFPVANWSRRSFTFKIDARATGWGLRLRFERNENSKGKKFRFKKPKLEKGSVPTGFTKSTYELEQSFEGVKERIEKTESIINDAGDRNYARNGDFTHYWADNDLQWDKNLNGNLRAGNWATGYNAGTTDPTKGYHMHVDDKKFGYPVVAVINKNGQFGQAKRWLGMPQEMPASFRNDFQPGDTYTIALDVWTETANNKIAVGLHHFIEGNNTMGFHSGGTPELTIEPVKKWVRVHTTMKLHDKSDMKKGFSLYIYGDRSADGSECYFKNVSVLKGSMPKAYAPSPEDGVKENVFSQKVTEITRNAEGITSDVKKIQEIQTQQGETLTQATTTILQQSEELKLAMKKKDVEAYVGGLGTVNELRDANFTLGPKYWFWNSGNGATGAVDTNLKYKGMNTFAITVTGQSQDRWWGLTSQFIECQVNEDFVASGYFNTDGKTPIDGGGAFIEIEWWTADKKTRIKTARTNITVVNHTWVRAVCTDKAPANAAFVRWRYYVTRNGRLWCAAPMLQRGTIATEFWLHPKDQTDADKMLEDIANRIATEDYNKKVTELERSISTNKEGVSIISEKQETFINETYAAYVKATGSKLKVLDEGILAEVKKGNIIAAINFSSEKLEIDVSKVAINADTMVKWLTAKGIDTNLIRIDGDKITIDKDGVTVKMLDFLFQDEWGTKTTAVSRRNLISDPDFSSVTKKNIGHTDYYGFEGGYGLTWKSWGNVVIEKNTHIFDYEQMVNAARVDMYNYPETVVNNGIHPGNEYTVSAHFRTAMINGARKTGKPRLQVCCVKFRDNVSYDIWNEQKMDFPEPSTFYGEIRRYSFTFKVPTNYIPQQHALIVKVCSGNADMRQGTAICVSGVTLYSGKYASM